MQSPRRLPSGRLASWDADPWRAGSFVLSVDGSEQSHVDIDDPTTLAWEYVRRIGFALDALRPLPEPLGVLHLGGGGLTLARYVALTRPGSPQVVVEAEEGLIDFVCELAPLPAASVVDVVTGDAAEMLPAQGRFDAIVVDVYLGTDVPEHLLGPDVVRELARHVVEDGVVVVNVADEPGAPLARGWRERFRTGFAETAMVAASDVVGGSAAGNVVLLASGGDGLAQLVDALLRHGPHPASRA